MWRKMYLCIISRVETHTDDKCQNVDDNVADDVYDNVADDVYDDDGDDANEMSHSIVNCTLL